MYTMLLHGTSDKGRLHNDDRYANRSSCVNSQIHCFQTGRLSDRKNQTCLILAIRQTTCAMCKRSCDRYDDRFANLCKVSGRSLADCISMVLTSRVDFTKYYYYYYLFIIYLLIIYYLFIYLFIYYLLFIIYLFIYYLFTYYLFTYYLFIIYLLFIIYHLFIIYLLFIYYLFNIYYLIFIIYLFIIYLFIYLLFIYLLFIYLLFIYLLFIIHCESKKTVPLLFLL